MTLRLPFVKGHGTLNDFLVIPDLEGTWDPSPAEVAWLCDRRSGLGADGVLRVVRTANYEVAGQHCSVADLFMDYRNADGSVAEMCGNGIRVFARYVLDSGVVSAGEFLVGTRSGCVEMRSESDGSLTAVLAGPVRPRPDEITVGLGDRTWRARGVDVPNPHAVILDVDLESLGDSLEAPSVGPSGVFPSGANVEFVSRRGPGSIAMRVYERGVGETLSCGTGACAAAWVARESWEPDCDSWRVGVRGGELRVEFPDDGGIHLNGPAILVAEGHVTLP